MLQDSSSLKLLVTFEEDGQNEAVDKSLHEITFRQCLGRDEEREGYDLQPLHPQVLVVDDDPMNIEVMQAMLDQLGITHDCAMNGKMAVKLISDRISLCEKEEAAMYKIVLLDYSMPDMDGP